MGRKILVVDDSPAFLKMLQTTLEGSGYDVVTAVDGEQAIARAAESHPDLIVLDVVLPKKNGFQVCREIKTRQNKRCKIIMLSSKNQESDKFWGMRQGADEYLTKPIEPKDLLSSVQRHL